VTREAMFAIDLIAISVMVFALYFPRHHRKDLVVAYLGVNVGVLAVSDALAATSMSAGLGLGLFGVLSIIRLRSETLDQEEVAYYFAALALGLLGGLRVSPTWLTAALMGVILVVLWVGDHPRLFAGYRTAVLQLEGTFTDEAALRAHLEGLLGGHLYHVRVRKVDLVRGTTSVEARYCLPVGVGDVDDAGQSSRRRTLR